MKKCNEWNIGIIVGFRPELDIILQTFSKNYGSKDIAGRRYHRGKLFGKRTVVVICGIGMINCAMTTQNLIDVFDPNYIFFSGIAGSINPNNKIGDVIINSKWIQYEHGKIIRTNENFNDFKDTEINFPDTYFEILPNKVLSFKRPNCDFCDNIDPNLTSQNDGVIQNDQFILASGFHIPMYVQTFTRGRDAYKKNIPEKFFFNTSNKLLNISKKIISNGTILPTKICENNICYTPSIRIGDIGISGSIFLDNELYRSIIFDKYAEGNYTVETVDMESAALAHVCVSNKKPFLVIRSASDLAGGSASKNVLEKFLSIAAENSMFVLFKIIKKID